MQLLRSEQTTVAVGTHTRLRVLLCTARASYCDSALLAAETAHRGSPAAWHSRRSSGKGASTSFCQNVTRWTSPAIPEMVGSCHADGSKSISGNAAKPISVRQTSRIRLNVGTNPSPESPIHPRWRSSAGIGVLETGGAELSGPHRPLRWLTTNAVDIGGARQRHQCSAR